MASAGNTATANEKLIIRLQVVGQSIRLRSDHNLIEVIIQKSLSIKKLNYDMPYLIKSRIKNNTSDSLRGDSPIVTEGCKALARFYGSKVDP